jgi:membrane protein insertase Oxa1/YidC/SpoIIIJ
MDLAHASFLWVHSLAQPDYALLVLYAISMFVSFRLSSTPPTDDQQRQMQLMMGFMMPFMMPVFLLHYPSAFVMYWMTFNATATILQWRMMKAADPHKNVIKTLMGADLKGVAAPDATDSVPSRPKSGKGESAVEKAVKTEEGGKSNGKASDGGGLNGHVNGKAANNGGPVTSGGSKKKKR